MISGDGEEVDEVRGDTAKVKERSARSMAARSDDGVRTESSELRRDPRVDDADDILRNKRKGGHG